MVSNLSLSEKLQSRLSRSFHASRALRFVPKSLRFLFWNFRKRSSCFLLVRLPSISRKPLDSRSLDFYAMKFSWFASLSGFLRPLLASFFILSHFRLFVKNFFPFFFSPSRRSRGLSETACLYYQIPSSLSIPFPLFFDKPKSLDVITSNISK